MSVIDKCFEKFKLRKQSRKMLMQYQFMEKLLMVINVYLIYCQYVRLFTTHRQRIRGPQLFEENEREMHGLYTKMLRIINEQDNEQFRQAACIGIHHFKILLNLLKSPLKKDSPRMSIETECRLLLTLVYLSQGQSWQTLAWGFRMGASTVREIILETCQVIWEELHSMYLAKLDAEEWRSISTDFYNKTGLPHCVGPVDGKCIKIKCPPSAGSSYSRFKRCDIILIAASDTDHRFTTADIAAYGETMDINKIDSRILNGNIDLPDSRELPYSTVSFPYYFVAGSTFPLRKHIMRPYPGRTISNDKKNFNRKLLDARRNIENTFGAMTSRWKVLLNSLNCFPKNAEVIVRAVIVLHNFAKMHDSAYCPHNYVDHYDEGTLVEGLWRKEGSNLPQSKLFIGFNAPQTAFAQRDILRKYINKS